MGARAHETDFHPHGADGVAVETGVKRGAPTPGAMGVDERVDGWRKFDPRQRLDEKIALPRAIGRRGEPLNGAAAAVAIMPADGRDPVGAGRQHLHQLAPIAIDLRDNAFAGKGMGHENLAARDVRDALAALAQMIDRQFGAQTHHANGFRAATRNSLLPSPPEMGDGSSPITFHPAAPRKPRMSRQTS